MLAPAPRLSVVVLADRFQTIERVVKHLGAQTVAAEIELVVGCSSEHALELPAHATQALSGVTVIETPLLPMGTARAAAVRAARGTVVVLGETHAFPAPDWAELLLRAHDSAEGVAPALENANPKSALSWAGFLMDYGRWLADPREEDHELSGLPAYNGSWNRDALIACGDRLVDLLHPGAPLEAALGARGARFSHEPAARIAHLNVSSPSAWARERYLGGALFAAHRSSRWSRARRVLYAGGSVLVPFIRLVRTRPALRQAGRARRLPLATLPAVALGCVLWAVGEAVGYVAPAAGAEAQMLEYELHKERYA
ncbi:MAG: hypothetical protein H0X39_13795 [Actinobacteria bacterium]|nr:hypothetical protein [Actinomycetota bacterium]